MIGNLLRIGGLFAIAQMLMLPLHAQDASELDLESLLNQRISSASKFTQRIADAPSAVTVITAEDIQRMGAIDLPDVLRMVPGLNVRTKSKGAVTVSARNGYEAGSPRVLVLLDGRATVFELHSITMWETLEVTLSQVERIEVVRGPGSALYGANAFDGVISIITKRPAGGTEVDVTAVGGDFGERGANVSGRTSRGALRFDGFLSTGESEVQNHPSSLAPVSGVHGTNDFTKGGVRLGWSNPSGVDLEVSGGISHGESLSYYHYAYGTFSEQLRNAYGQVRYTHPQLIAGAALTAQLYHNTRYGTADGWDASTSHAEFMLDRSVGSAHRVIAGAVARNVSSGHYSVLDGGRSHFLPAMYVQDAWTISPRWELTGGVRFDHHPETGGKVSPRCYTLVQALAVADCARLCRASVPQPDTCGELPSSAVRNRAWAAGCIRGLHRPASRRDHLVRTRIGAGIRSPHELHGGRLPESARKSSQGLCRKPNDHVAERVPNSDRLAPDQRAIFNRSRRRSRHYHDAGRMAAPSRQLFVRKTGAGGWAADDARAGAHGKCGVCRSSAPIDVARPDLALHE